MTQPLLTGTIQTIKPDRGFFFIRGEDGTEYFAHASACTDAPFSTLSQGDPVRFVPSDGPRGPRAEWVSVV